jgi:hypothetical protein
MARLAKGISDRGRLALQMARRDRKSPSEDSVEKETLSERMRALLSIATLEERRRSGAPSGKAGERRRRTDKRDPEQQAD